MKNTITDLLTGLELQEEKITINWNEQDIEVKGYLSMDKKREMINWVISQSRRSKAGNLSVIDLEKKWDIAIVNYYTNFKFDIINKDYYNEVYDILNTNNFFDLIVTSIPAKEYSFISEKFKEEVDKDNEYQMTIAANIEKMFGSLKESISQSEEAFRRLEEFDISKFEQVKTLAEKMGMNNVVPMTTIEKKDK